MFLLLECFKRFRRKAYFVSLFLNMFVFVMLPAQAASFEAKIDAMIQKKLPHATVGIMIQDAKTGHVVYRKNADKLLSPASNIKLFTAIALMHQFKLNHRFSTILAKKGQHVYITFTGSPSLTREQFRLLVAQLKKHDIRTIEGNIILDTSMFHAPNYDNGLSYDDMGWYYAAPVGAIILDENAEKYEFTTAHQLGLPVHITAKTSQPPVLTIVNDVVTATAEQEKEHCALHLNTQSGNKLRVFGCLAQRDEPVIMKFAVSDPLLVAKQDIQQVLHETGIVLKGRIEEGKTPVDAHVIAVHESDDLIKLITHMLHTSDNLYADSFVKQLGYALTQQGTFKQGIFAIKEILKKHTHLDFTQLELADGVGTRYNLVTPEQMVTLLSDIYHDQAYYESFVQALPQAGVSGTLQFRMKQSILEKNVFAKTGSMHDISSLSGYVLRSHAHPLIFSIIINGIHQPIQAAHAFEEDVLLLAVTQG